MHLPGRRTLRSADGRIPFAAGEFRVNFLESLTCGLVVGLLIDLCIYGGRLVDGFMMIYVSM